jgi:hypothetical protein
MKPENLTLAIVYAAGFVVAMLDLFVWRATI